MKSRLVAVMLALIMAAVAAPASAQWDMSKRKEYEDVPFWLEGKFVPTVLLILERDWKMFYPAYNNLADLDGDGALDIGFNPGVTYVGYFDPDSCYEYVESGATPRFVRVGPATPQTVSGLKSLIPQEIKDISKDTDGDGLYDLGIKTPLSKHGVCARGAATRDGQGQWHGNWMNFSTTSRMDAIRKVLYGGTRYTETPQVILELVPFLPSNAHTWGGELLADDIWFEFAKSSPWYDIPSFTGYQRPFSQTRHFWARSSYYTNGAILNNRTPTQDAINGRPYSTRTYANRQPLFLVAADIPVTNWHPVYKTPLRYWDWVGDHGIGSMPDDHNLIAGPDISTTGLARSFANASYPKKPRYEASRRFVGRIEVCIPGNSAAGEQCKEYPDGSSKPIGLLQDYGEAEKMYFGLLTGSLDSTKRWQGGMVRHHIDKFSNIVDPVTGNVVVSGLIDTIDRLQITGIGENRVAAGTSHTIYSDGTQAGNPLGEMLYEGVRYMSRFADGSGLGPNVSAYVSTSEVALPSYARNGGTTPGRSQLPKLVNKAQWDARATFSDAEADCPKPIILIISEVVPDHDRDDSNDSYPNKTDFSKVPLLSKYKGGGTDLPAAFNMNSYLDLITKTDRIGTGYDNNQYFFPQTTRNICMPGNLTTGLVGMVGHCPSEPSLQGTYNVAAIAYYAHTHDMSNLSNAAVDAKHQEKAIDVYAVGIPGNFPDITFKIDDDRGFTLMPITVASDLEATNLRTLINFFMETWEVDVNERPFRAKFATNFEYNTTPSWASGSGSNNMERDIFNRFDIIVLTTRDTPVDYRETVPVFINSGPLRTRNETKWFADKAAGVYNDTADQKYYYAFKNPNPNKFSGRLDITQHNIAGLAIQSYTHGSYINMRGHGGYTIAGVTRPGAYIEAGYHGSDNGTTCNNDNQPVVLTGDYRSNQGMCPTNGVPDRRGLPPGHRNPNLSDALATPWECPFAGYTNANSGDPDVVQGYGTGPTANQVCGTGGITRGLMRYYQMRSFFFDTSAANVENLPNALWLAAKYGGFRDTNNDGVPSNDAEWKRMGSGTDRDDPYNYFGVANISQLPTQLGKAFETISDSVATGTANASSINSVLGGGISLQTQYRTEYIDKSSRQIKWAGDVYALLVDKWGNLRVDTTKDGALQVKTGAQSASDWNALHPGNPSPPPYPGEEGDYILHAVSLPDNAGLPTYYLCTDLYGNNNASNPLPTDEHPSSGKYAGINTICNLAGSGNFESVSTYWSMAKHMVGGSFAANRRVYSYFDFNDGTNYNNGDGTTANNSWGSGVDLGGYEFKEANAEALKVFLDTATPPAGITTANLINYVRGVDMPGVFRNRTVTVPWEPDGSAPKVWPLGDVINSKPVIVGGVSGNYNYTYGDTSFAAYKDKWAKRRQVAYFGANDGMLHAVNVGFFGSLASGYAGYSDTTGTAMGEELWAYIPTAVLPHLRWLSDLGYNHSYYVDLKPTIVDMKINSDWRTVMIVGLRMGGRTIENESMPGTGQAKMSYCEYFALDVTDPDKTPTLLWRYSSPTLGQSTALPAVVRADDEWYVVLPSGPTSDEDNGSGVIKPSKTEGAKTAYYGVSSQKARVHIINASTGLLEKELVAEDEGSFFNDSYVPRAIEVKNRNTDSASWSHHVVYLGMSVAPHVKIPVYAVSSGAVYRLQLGNGDGTPLPKDEWKLNRFYKTDKPVTGAINSTTDDVGNLWVLFGTGRVWHQDDQTPCGSVDLTGNAAFDACVSTNTQYLYGLKEPQEKNGNMTFAEVKDSDTIKIEDVSGLDVYSDGVFRDSSFKAVSTDNKAPAKSTSPNNFANWYALSAAMKDKKSDGTAAHRGYKRKLQTWQTLPVKGAGNTYEKQDSPGNTVFEIITTQPKLDAVDEKESNMVFSTYITACNICEPLGDGYLYVVNTYTGLPAPYMIDYSLSAGMPGPKDGDTVQITGIKRSGVGMPSEAWIIKSSEGTMYGNTSYNSARNTVFVPKQQSNVSAYISWREVTDMGFDMKEGTQGLFDDLK